MSPEGEDVPMWEASPERKKEALVVGFLKHIVCKYGPLPITSEGATSHTLDRTLFEQLHQWTLLNMPLFWSEVWDYFGVIGDKGRALIEHGKSMMYTQFLPEAKLSYSENLLKYCSKWPKKIGLVGWVEDSLKEEITFQEVYDRVSVLSQAFADAGLKEGDRVGGVVGNTPNAFIAMLAVNSLGGVWSSCSPDFGVHGLRERFGQITPKFLVCSDHYTLKNIDHDVIEKVSELASLIPSVQKVIVMPYLNNEPYPPKAPQISLSEFTHKYKPKPINFIRTPFNGPIFILYSSGTTGPPKCFVHRTGVLLKLLTEHQFHLDIKEGYKVMHATTAGWMMWNWITATFASGASLVTYDGSQFFPKVDHLWHLADQQKLNYLGLSPKYLENLKKNGVFDIQKKFDLSQLKIIGTAGSPLTKSSFEYVYGFIKKDLHLSSFTGGTDLMSCFFSGNPLGPVFSGELQTICLGVDAKVFDDEGNSIKCQNGELVCINPWVSQPLYFYNDPHYERYKEAYFMKYPGIWAHSDLTEITRNNGIVVHGRSDSVLNPGGVRIGTSEIYRIVEQLPDIAECAAVERKEHSEKVDIYLFVVMNPGYIFDQEFVAFVKKFIRENSTPFHVPKEIKKVNAIPATKTGKIAELAIRAILHHNPVKNLTALENPQCLEEYKKFSIPLKSRL